MITEVSKITGLSTDDILGTSRKQPLALVRQAYWKLLMVKRKYTYSEVARLNNRTPATVMHGIDVIDHGLKYNYKDVTKLWSSIKDIPT